MRLLDLFCGAGGAAMGYSRAGFDIVGIDHVPQPHYPFEFVQADALEYLAEHGHEFDAIHASPPCQFYSRLRHLPWLRHKRYWRSIPPTREGLVAAGKPWVIENVLDAGWDMGESIVVCGQMFGLHLFRHRRFASSFLMLAPPHERHHWIITPGRATLATRHQGLNAWGGEAGHQAGVQRHRRNMDIDWMTGKELGQAVPPAYTYFVGSQLMRQLARMEALP